MAPRHNTLFILTLLVIAVDAKIHKSYKFPLPFPVFGGETKKEHIMENNNDAKGNKNVKKMGDANPGVSSSKPDFEAASNFIGNWEIINQNAGVSAMHVNLLPTNKIMIYDATVYRTSRIQYPPGEPCVPWRDVNANQDKQDCFAHSVEYDLETNQVRPLKVTTDPWCSSGGLAPDGTLVVSGGFNDGAKSLRYYGGPNCQGNNCDWRIYDQKLKDERWYGTQVLLANGNFIVIGGRRSFSYEYLPTKEGETNEKPFFFPFLYETSDIDENNLYPFVHLTVDGNLFIFSNNRSLLLNPTTNRVVQTFPPLPGGARNYPASGMSVLLPLNLREAEIKDNGVTMKVEVMVCGGNSFDAFVKAETEKKFLPALKDCGRMVISDPNPKWEKEEMPSGRTMGDALILPNGNILFINGAREGTAAWWDADNPNFTPVLYNPLKPSGERFTELQPTQIARMYHSTSAVMPNGKIFVSGSNTHDTYRDVDKFPTETRVEAFAPPYMDSSLDPVRPLIAEDASAKELNYGSPFDTQFSVQSVDQEPLTKDDIKVTIYFPPFTTHGYSMNQRLVILQSDVSQVSQGVYKVHSTAPPTPQIAPSGYYLLFVVHRGVPGKGMWVQLK